MTLEEFTRYMLSHSSGRTVVPAGEIMAERVWTGLKRIARDTTPLILTVNDPLGYTVLRKIDASTFIRKPNKPKLGTAQALDIDEILLDALAYYALAGLETQRAKVYMGMYWGEINSFNDILIETDLNVATNEAPRFRRFP